MLKNNMAIYRLVLLPQKRRVFAIILARLFAQLGLLTSLILPWQLLQILSTGHSRISDSFAANMSVNVSLFGFSFLIAVSFLLYLWLNQWVERAYERLSNQVIENLGKTKLMPNHHQIAKQSMAVMVKSISSLLNSLVFYVLCCFIYWKAGVVLGIYMFILAAIFFRKYRQYKQCQKTIELQQLLQRYLLLLINGSLVFVFIVIVYDYTVMKLPPFLTIFMSVLIARQAVQSLVQWFLFQLGMVRRQKNIDLLFLPRSKGFAKTEIEAFEKQFAHQHIHSWLPDFFKQITTGLSLNHFDVLDVISCRLNQKGKVAYVVFSVKLNDSLHKHILLKCFHPTLKAQYEHEVVFLQSYKKLFSAKQEVEDNDYVFKNTPLPKLIAAKSIDWMSSELFYFSTDAEWKNSSTSQPFIQKIQSQLYQLTVIPELVNRYEKAHDDLVDKMCRLNWSRFDYLTQSEKELHQLTILMNSWNSLIAYIQLLPKVINLEFPHMRRMAVYDNQPIIYDWHTWVYDWAGTNWKISSKLKGEIENIVSDLESHLHQPTITYINKNTKDRLIQHMVLSARLHEFCRRLSIKNDSGAINMIPGILKLIHKEKFN